MNHNSRNILIIDDDKDVCVFLKNLLSKDGYSVKTLIHPTKALSELKRKEYHVVILDLKMPDISGEDMLKEIIKIRPEISVIISTAYPTVKSAIETFKNKAFDYITKPYHIEDMRQSIKNALRSRMLLIDQEEELKKIIGIKLRELREKNSFTLKQLAERAGISFSLVAQIERAETAASISTINKLANSLNMRLDHFFVEVFK